MNLKLLGKTIRGIRDAIPGGHLIGRLSSGSGAPEVISLGQIVDAIQLNQQQGGGKGIVSSVALTMPAEFSVAGSPGTSDVTLVVTKAVESAKEFYAGPVSGSAAAPTFRLIASTDLPSALSAFGVASSCQDISTKPLNTIVARSVAGIIWTLPSVANGGFAEGYVTTAPASDTVFGLNIGGSSVGSVKWAAGSHTPVLTKAADSVFALGDYLDLVTPANFNGMAGAFGLAIMGTR